MIIYALYDRYYNGESYCYSLVDLYEDGDDAMKDLIELEDTIAPDNECQTYYIVEQVVIPKRTANRGYFE